MRQNSWIQNLAFLIMAKTEISDKARRKRHVLRKTNSPLKKKGDQPTEHMFHNKRRTAQPHSWHISRHQRVRMHRELPDYCPTWRRNKKKHYYWPIASRDNGAVLLTATKTNKESVRRGFLTLGVFLPRTQDMILFQHRVRRDEQTERVCAENASLIPIRRATNTIRPRKHGHTRTDAATRPHPRAHTHARTPEDDHHRFVFGIFERLTFSTFQFFKNLSDI